MNTRRAQRWVLGLLILLASVGVSIGCGGYPTVSPKAYELAKLLDNACNVRQPDQLLLFRDLVNDAHASGDISAQERAWLLSITDSATEGKWDQAASEVRRLMLDQNRQAPSPIPTQAASS